MAVAALPGLPRSTDSTPLYCDVCGIPDVEHPKSSTHAITQEPNSRKRSPKFSTHDSIQFPSIQISDPTGNMSTEVPESKGWDQLWILTGKAPEPITQPNTDCCTETHLVHPTDLAIPSYYEVNRRWSSPLSGQALPKGRRPPLERYHSWGDPLWNSQLEIPLSCIIMNMA